ncbi:MAG: GTPase domain-containing protein [Gemmatimonadota bacterium]|nr:GTPase domain-containing protein [Gemmatimonadota bacterium]
MPTLIYGRRQISLRIVYAGPGLGGKTTNLEQLERLVAGAEGQLTQIPTAGERTVGGDFLPVGAEALGEWTPRFQLATVPGQLQYAGAREILLRNVDVVVFVADSLRLRRPANRAALDELHRTLAEGGRDPRRVPLVLQYNKRDLADILTVTEMDAELNPAGAPAVASIATSAIGVVEAFGEAVSLALGEAERFLSPRSDAAPLAVSIPETDHPHQ